MDRLTLAASLGPVILGKAVPMLALLDRQGSGPIAERARVLEGGEDR